MSKVNVGIYPFDESFVPVIRYKELFDKYRFCLFINHNGNILSEEEIKEKSTSILLFVSKSSHFIS